ncbi:hypothetical protein Efla_000553 [Eimeria flavescens]
MQRNKRPLRSKLEDRFFPGAVQPLELLSPAASQNWKILAFKMSAGFFFVALCWVSAASGAPSGQRTPSEELLGSVFNEMQGRTNPSNVLQSKVPYASVSPVHFRVGLRRKELLSQTTVLAAFVALATSVAVALLILQCFKAFSKAAWGAYSARRLGEEEGPQEEAACMKLLQTDHKWSLKAGPVVSEAVFRKTWSAVVNLQK